MKLLFGSFTEWEHFQYKDLYIPLAISVTVPKLYYGQRYEKLTPSKDLFLKTYKEGYEPSKFFNAYYNEIKVHSKQGIFNDLLSLNKDVCLLGWEKYNVLGECWFCIAWLKNISMKDALSFEIIKNSYKEDRNFFEI